jgi:hypothetical protein
VAIPAKVEDYYNLIEYQGYNNMIDIVNKFNLRKIIPESYCVLKSNIHSFQTLTPFEINLIFPLLQTELSADSFKPII